MCVCVCVCVCVCAFPGESADKGGEEVISFVIWPFRTDQECVSTTNMSTCHMITLQANTATLFHVP